MEKLELESIYQINSAELVAVYGRRRAAKTYLINQFFDGKFFKHAGLSPQEDVEFNCLSKQIDYFYNSLIAINFILKYVPFGYSKREEIILNDDYKLFANQYGYIDESDKSYNKIKVRPYSLAMLKK